MHWRLRVAYRFERRRSNGVRSNQKPSRCRLHLHYILVMHPYLLHPAMKLRAGDVDLHEGLRETRGSFALVLLPLLVVVVLGLRVVSVEVDIGIVRVPLVAERRLCELCFGSVGTRNECMAEAGRWTGSCRFLAYKVHTSFPRPRYLGRPKARARVGYFHLTLARTLNTFVCFRPRGNSRESAPSLYTGCTL